MQTRIVPRSNPRSHETAAGLFKSSMYRWDEICKANVAALRLRDLVCWSCSTFSLSLSLSLHTGRGQKFLEPLVRKREGEGERERGRVEKGGRGREGER